MYVIEFHNPCRGPLRVYISTFQTQILLLVDIFQLNKSYCSDMGFDMVEVIKKMDVSDEPGNSIEQIEQFIAAEHPDLISSKSKKFPPGHRIRIKEFIDNLRQSKKVTLGKRQYSGTSHKETSKRQRMSSCDTSDHTDSDHVSDIGKIRCQICNWQRTQTNESMQNLNLLWLLIEV